MKRQPLENATLQLHEFTAEAGKKYVLEFRRKAGLFRREPVFKFVIRPADLKDLIEANSALPGLIQKVAKNEITYDAAAQALAVNFKDLGFMDACKMLFTKCVIYPKVVLKISDIKDDEVSFDALPPKFTRELFNAIVSISPILQGNNG